MIKILLCIFLSLGNLILADSKAEAIIAHVQTSLQNAEMGISKLPSKILQIEGLSSPKERRLLNNLCSYPDTCYFEVGCFHGATLISALYDNRDSIRDAVAVDNFSEFGNRRGFDRNIRAYLPTSGLRFFEQDSFKMDTSTTFPNPITVYFYDGNHLESSQEAAFTYFDPVFDDPFVAVIDDWNWECVRNGTKSAFQKLQYTVLFQQEYFTNDEDATWNNGVYIAVIQKKKV